MKGAERVHVTLSDDAAVDAIVPEVVQALPAGAWLVDHTTTSPFGTRDRYARMERAKVAFVHAPVFMSPAMARDAKGMILLSGPRERCDRLSPLLAPMTGDVWYVGERLEDAAAYKLFGNAMILLMSGGIADLFAMARGMGLEPGDAVGVFEKLIPGVAVRAARMVTGDFTPSFELTMARKDLRLCLDAAERSGLPLAVLPSLAKRFDDVIAAGRGAEDYSVIAAEALAGARPDADDPFAQLERCHRRLEERIAELARAPGDPDARARFFEFLDRSIRRHEDDEEESLFPRLAGVAELAPVIASLRAEHRAQVARQRALREATDEATRRARSTRWQRRTAPTSRRRSGCSSPRRARCWTQRRRRPSRARCRRGEARRAGREAGAVAVAGGGGRAR